MPPTTVTISSATIGRIKDSLNAVQTNAQALAAADASLSAAFDLQNVLMEKGGAFREAAAKDIRDIADRLQLVRGQLDGNPSGAVGNAWASTVKPRVFDLWVMLLTIESMYPPDANFGDSWKDALLDSVSHFEENLTIGAQKVGKFVGAVTGAAANVAGTAASSTVVEFLKKAWFPLLLVGGALLVFLVARKKVEKLL
jgi:hypothetical protein